MHYFREMILLFYIVSIAMGVAGLTCCVLPILPNLRKKTEPGKHMALFIGGLLATCFYDMIIYYGNYVLGIFSNLEVMRIGNCIIAGTMCLWILLQQRIIPREALKFLDRVMLRYLPLYSIVWLVLTIVLSLKQFYSLKWLLLSSDIILILGFLSVCVAHIIYAAVAGEKNRLLLSDPDYRDASVELHLLFLERDLCLLGQQRIHPRAHGSDHYHMDGNQCGQPCLQLPKNHPASL